MFWLQSSSFLFFNASQAGRGAGYLFIKYSDSTSLTGISSLSCRTISSATSNRLTCPPHTILYKPYGRLFTIQLYIHLAKSKVYVGVPCLSETAYNASAP